MSAPLTSIAVLGDGLAGSLACAVLARALPADVSLSLVSDASASETDLFYGTTTSPTAYDVFLGLDLPEPVLFQNSDTTPSLGTQYDWAGQAWIQGFHQPLPVMGGVEFHQYVARAGGDYSDFVMSLAAARRGGFAHPPQGKKTPLASLEYGYHLLPGQLAALLRDGLPGRVQRTPNIVDADLIIDARRQDGADWARGRTLHGSEELEPSDGPVGVVRRLCGQEAGWTATTPLRAQIHTLSLGQGDASIKLGRCEAPWSGKTVAFGHKASALSPLTCAPLTLLMRDAQRLAELIPFSTDMTVEAREYNRRHQSDFDHAHLFERAFFATDHPARLAHKITQFESRGALVQYDLEPFESTEWLLQHLGMGRTPAGHDRLADRVPEPQLRGQLSAMHRSVDTVASKLPPVKTYHDGLLKYLKKKAGEKTRHG